MAKDPKLGKHSHNNRESKEGTALRFIRESKKYSLKDIAAKLNLKVADIDHFENGRKFYTTTDIDKFLECYEFSRVDFDDMMKLKVLNKQLVNHFLANKILKSDR